MANIVINGVSNSQITVGGDFRLGDDYTHQPSINELIGKGKIEEALNVLTSQGNDVILLKSRFSRLKREENLGLIGFSAATIERSRIVAAILDINGTEIVASPTVVAQTVNYWIIGGVNCQDPAAFQTFISKTRHGVTSEYKEAIQFGNAVLSYTKGKFDERTFNTEFSPLRYAVEDLQSRPTLENMKVVINQVQKHQDLILRFLKKEVKESLLEKMYNNANDDDGRTFLEKYDIFLKKYLEINTTADQKVYEKWLYDRNEFFEDAGADEDDLYFKSQMQGLRNKWLRKFRP